MHRSPDASYNDIDMYNSGLSTADVSIDSGETIKAGQVIVDLETKQLESAARVMSIGATTSVRQTCHVDDEDDDINNNVVLDPGTLDFAGRPSVDELDEQYALFEAAVIWAPLLILSSRANAPAEVGVFLAGAIGGSPPEVGVLLTGGSKPRRIKGRKSVRFSSTTCQCDVCPSPAMHHGLALALPHAYVHNPEVQHAAMTNFCKFYCIEEADEEQIMATALGISG